MLSNGGEGMIKQEKVIAKVWVFQSSQM